MLLRTQLVLFALLLALSAPTAAQQDSPAIWLCPSGFTGQRLNIFNWSTYIASDTIANFEEACGVQVSYELYESNEVLVEKLREGRSRYDLVVPSDYAAATLIEEGLLAPINFNNIPNFANIRDDLKNPPYDPDNLYTVPYQLGGILLAYHEPTVGDEMTSWAEMFEYPRKVSWVEHGRAMLSIALSMLDYDPNSADPAEIAAARDYLISHSRNVTDIPGDDGQLLLEGDEVEIVVEYSGDIAQLIAACQCDEYVLTVPEEGAPVMLDVMAIPANARNQALAEVFIDYILHPQVSADISNEILYTSPNQEAIRLGLIDEAQLNNPGIYPADGTRQRMYLLEPLPSDVQQLYDEAWDAVKESIFARLDG